MKEERDTERYTEREGREGNKEERKNCNRNDLFGHKEQDRGPSWVRGVGNSLGLLLLLSSLSFQYQAKLRQQR